MSSKIENLLSSFEKVLAENWNITMSGQEKVWFLVYDPEEQRKVDLRIVDFESLTKKSNRKWLEINIKYLFSEWLSNHEYKEEYFQEPDVLIDQIESEFKDYIIENILTIMSENNADENTLVVMTGVSSLFGFLKLSGILQDIYKVIKGRLMIFFPGEFVSNNYRLMNSRDGWSYLARPITI